MPEQIVIRCACGQAMRATRADLGKTGRCVACGRAVRVQESATPAVRISEFESDGGIGPSIREMTDVPARFTAGKQRENPAVYAGPGDSMQRLHELWGEQETPVPAEPALPPRAVARTPVPAAPDRTRCARCGRALRGDWDRHEREEGLLCNVCARQLPPERTPWDPPVERGTIPPPSDHELRELARLTNRREKPPRDPDKYRTLPAFLAFGATTLLLIWLLPVEEWLNSLMLNVFSTEMPPRGTPAYYRVLAVALVNTYLAQVAALYLAALQADRLPHDHFFMNLAHVAMVSLFLCFLSFVASVFSTFTPGMYVLLVYGLVGAIQVYLIWSIYNLALADILFYFLIRYVCGVLFALLNPIAQSFMAWAVPGG